MGTTSRFLDIYYVLNSIKIKGEALRLKLLNGAYPYSHFKDTIDPQTELHYDHNFQDIYHSLSYLNIGKAEQLHSGAKSITQEIILGLVYYNDYITKKEVDQDTILEKANWIKNQGSLEGDRLTFYIQEEYVRFDLKGRYSSGIVQGKVASLFIRCFSITQEQKYLDWAKQSLLAAWTSKEKGGSLIQITKDLIWIEEYPSPKPSMVLNGFLFYIIGLTEYFAIEKDKDIGHKLGQSLQSALSWLPKFKQKKGILYSMYRWSLCNIHYTGIMKYQFEHLYQLTCIDEFNEMAEFTDKLTPWDTFKKLI